MLKEIVNLDKTVEEGMIVLIVMIELENLIIITTNIEANTEEDPIQGIVDIQIHILQDIGEEKIREEKKEEDLVIVEIVKKVIIRIDNIDKDREDNTKKEDRVQDQMTEEDQEKRIEGITNHINMKIIPEKEEIIKDKIIKDTIKIDLDRDKDMSHKRSIPQISNYKNILDNLLRKGIDIKDPKNIKKGQMEDMIKSAKEREKRSQMKDIWDKENNL